jgi:hypothetical protein
MEQPKKKNRAAAALGRRGGRVKVSKGFASPEVMRKALETRKLRREERLAEKGDR